MVGRGHSIVAAYFAHALLSRIQKQETWSIVNPGGVLNDYVDRRLACSKLKYVGRGEEEGGLTLRPKEREGE